MSFLRLRAKPLDAVAHAVPASLPNASEKLAITRSSSPYRKMTSMPQPALIWLTSCAVTNGMMHSITTSIDTKVGARRDGFLYSRMLLIRTFHIPLTLLLFHGGSNDPTKLNHFRCAARREPAASGYLDCFAPAPSASASRSGSVLRKSRCATSFSKIPPSCVFSCSSRHSNIRPSMRK